MRNSWLYLRCIIANRYTNLALATTALALAFLFPAILSGSTLYLVLAVVTACVGFIAFIALGAGMDTYMAYQATSMSFMRDGMPQGHLVSRKLRHQVRAGIELACKHHKVKVWDAIAV